MAFTEQDLAALKAAIKSGTRRVTYGDRTVEYQSIADMLAAYRFIESQIEPEPPAASKRSGIFRIFQSGRG